MKFVTLTTDFGTRDWFVGTMKGVIAGIAPRAQVIDLTHEIPPGEIAAGAFSLLCGYAYCPRGTIHVAVVDPGVGSGRRAIAVRTSRFFFLGPDNGVLSWALRCEQVREVRVLENRALCLKLMSSTFHGRDLFAPMAAHLAAGVAFGELGPSTQEYVRLDWPDLKQEEGKVVGQVVYIDRFGNALTNIPNSELKSGQERTCEVKTKRRWRMPVGEFYQAVRVSRPVAVPGSSGYLEVAVNGGSARQLLGLKRGTKVVLSRQRAKASHPQLRSR